MPVGEVTRRAVGLGGRDTLLPDPESCGFGQGALACTTNSHVPVEFDRSTTHVDDPDRELPVDWHCEHMGN
jgi:hypothetical protein